MTPPARSSSSPSPSRGGSRSISARGRRSARSKARSCSPPSIGLTELALRGDRPLVYIVFPALAWGALRFGPRGGTLAVAVAVGFTLWKTAHHAGPFVVDSIPRSTLSTQLYVGVAALSTMFLAAVVSEREAFAKGLLESRARLVGIADRERRRLEHNLHDGAQLTLTMLAGQLSSARDKAARRPEVAPLLFDEAEKNLLVAIDQLRELAHGIHPTILTDLGLGEAIRSLTAGSPVPIQLVELPSGRLDPSAEATAYYVVAEALTNAQRHAQATTITIRVAESSRSPEDRRQRRRRRWSRRVERVGPAGPPRPGGSRRRNTSGAERRRTRYAGRRRHPSGASPAGRLRLLDERRLEMQRFMVTIEGPTWQDIQDMELPRAPALGESIETRYGTCVVTKVEAPAGAEKYTGKIVCRLP